jgi:NitT/TauT family transport system substrate-binding protein
MSVQFVVRGLALALASSLAVSLPAAAKETVRVGICVSWPGYSIFEIVKQKGLAPDYDIEQTIFEDPVGGHSALAAGQIDIYACTGDYVPLIAERGTDVVEVAFTAPSYGVDHIILAPGMTPDKLKGQKVGAPEAYIGSLLAALFIDAHGIRPDEVEWVNLNADEAVGPMVGGNLAAAYMYEPWISKVVEQMPEAKSGISTIDPAMLKTGIFMDVLYMNKSFIAGKRKAALDMLRAYWDALAVWHENTDEINQLFADFLKWPKTDVEFVIGTNGKFFEGGVYIYDFDESARVCGVLEGDGPFGVKNGQIIETAATVNDWWIKLGLMKAKVDVAKAIDCSLMGDLVKEGYRQSFTAR